MDPPKPKIPQSVVNIQVSAAAANASVAVIKSKPVGVPPRAVGFAVGYLQAQAEMEQRREIDTAERLAAAHAAASNLLTQGIQSGAISSDQANSLAKKYRRGYSAWRYGPGHDLALLKIEYRLAQEVRKGNLSHYSQGVLSAQLTETGNMFLPSEEKVGQAIAEAAEKDAKKLEQLAALYDGKEDEPQDRWYHGTDAASAANILAHGLSRELLLTNPNRKQTEELGFFVTPYRDIAETYGDEILYWEEREIGAYLEGIGRNDEAYIPFDCFDKVPRPKRYKR
jgi:hypothetical protein